MWYTWQSLFSRWLTNVWWVQSKRCDTGGTYLTSVLHFPLWKFVMHFKLCPFNNRELCLCAAPEDHHVIFYYPMRCAFSDSITGTQHISTSSCQEKPRPYTPSLLKQKSWTIGVIRCGKQLPFLFKSAQMTLVFVFFWVKYSRNRRNAALDAYVWF